MLPLTKLRNLSISKFLDNKHLSTFPYFDLHAPQQNEILVFCVSNLRLFELFHSKVVYQNQRV